MKKSVTLLAASIALLLMMPLAWAADDWLVGKWEMTYDSQNSPKDWLEFTTEGKAVAITPDGRRIPGRYVIKDSQIEIVYSYDGKIVPLTLRYTDARDKLFAYSAKTKISSQYKKVSGEQ